jgi:hypothetical protein
VWPRVGSDLRGLVLDRLAEVDVASGVDQAAHRWHSRSVRTVCQQPQQVLWQLLGGVAVHDNARPEGAGRQRLLRPAVQLRQLHGGQGLEGITDLPGAERSDRFDANIGSSQKFPSSRSKASCGPGLAIKARAAAKARNQAEPLGRRGVMVRVTTPR